jgi:O-antigen ligase
LNRQDFPATRAYRSPHDDDSGQPRTTAGIADQAARRPAAATSNRLAALLLLAVVALAPLPYGSVGPVPVLAWCFLLAIALGLASLRALDGRHFLVLSGVMIVVCAYLLVLHEQVSTHPFFPFARPDPAWQAAGDVIAMPIRPSVAMVRDQPLLSIGPPLAAILSLLVGFIVCVNRDHAHRLIHAVAWSGTAYAIFGIIAFLIDPTYVLWMKKEAYTTVLTSTFINRNSAAIYFGSCAIIWLLILADRARAQLPRGISPSLSLLAQLLRHPRRRAVVEFAAFFACLIAMFLTGSRAGVMLSLLAVVMAFGLFTLKVVPLGSKRMRLFLTAGCVAIILMQVLGAGVLGRVDREGLSGEGRLQTYRSTLAMIDDHPWLGTGLGTFAWVFPAYRSDAESSWGTWDRAHSTPLEIAAEMGVPLAAVVVASWAGAFIILGFGLWNRNRDHILVIAALAVGGLAVLHSLIDFSLQIPGVAIVVFALVGAGLAQSFRAARASISDPRGEAFP